MAGEIFESAPSYRTGVGFTIPRGGLLGDERLHVLHARTHLSGTVRASPHVFNTSEEIDRLIEGVREIAE